MFQSAANEGIRELMKGRDFKGLNTSPFFPMAKQENASGVFMGHVWLLKTLYGYALINLE